MSEWQNEIYLTLHLLPLHCEIRVSNLRYVSNDVFDVLDNRKSKLMFIIYISQFHITSIKVIEEIIENDTF